MTHEIFWLTPGRVLYVGYKGHQTRETLKACLDDIVVELDKVDRPVVCLISWTEVASMEQGTLMSHREHMAYKHPMSARAVLVGFNQVEAFQNEVSAATARGGQSHTRYFQTIEEAKVYLELMLKDEPVGENNTGG